MVDDKQCKSLLLFPVPALLFSWLVCGGGWVLRVLPVPVVGPLVEVGVPLSLGLPVVSDDAFLLPVEVGGKSADVLEVPLSQQEKDLLENGLPLAPYFQEDLPKPFMQRVLAFVVGEGLLDELGAVLPPEPHVVSLPHRHVDPEQVAGELDRQGGTSGLVSSQGEPRLRKKKERLMLILFLQVA